MVVENPSIASEVPASASETILNYWKRRAYITDTFINKTPADEVLQVESKSGPADVRVLSTMCEIPDELRDPNKMQAKENVTMAVFVPGMFEVAQNYGSHPLESRLAGGLLTSETDAVIMLKAEGQDRKAFEEVHKTTSTAAFQVLEKQITEYLKMHPDCKTINLKVLGYSEGSTQGASLTARIIEHIQEAKAEGRPAIDGLDTLNMKEYLSICGGGLAGNAKVADVNLGEVLINNIRAMNPDYETIVNSPDTKLTVVAGSKDIYFPGEVVATNLKEIVAASDDPERAVGKTVLIKGDIPHEFPHGNTDGLAYMIELLKNKAYGQENTNNAQVLV